MRVLLLTKSQFKLFNLKFIKLKKFKNLLTTEKFQRRMQVASKLDLPYLPWSFSLLTMLCLWMRLIRLRRRPREFNQIMKKIQIQKTLMTPPTETLT